MSWNVFPALIMQEHTSKQKYRDDSDCETRFSRTLHSTQRLLSSPCCDSEIVCTTQYNTYIHTFRVWNHAHSQSCLFRMGIIIVPTIKPNTMLDFFWSKRSVAVPLSSEKVNASRLSTDCPQSAEKDSCTKWVCECVSPTSIEKHELSVVFVSLCFSVFGSNISVSGFCSDGFSIGTTNGNTIVFDMFFGSPWFFQRIWWWWWWWLTKQYPQIYCRKVGNGDLAWEEWVISFYTLWQWRHLPFFHYNVPQSISTDKCIWGDKQSNKQNKKRSTGHRCYQGCYWKPKDTFISLDWMWIPSVSRIEQIGRWLTSVCEPCRRCK